MGFRWPVRVEASYMAAAGVSGVMEARVAVRDYVPAGMRAKAILDLSKNKKAIVNLPMDDEGFEDTVVIHNDTWS